MLVLTRKPGESIVINPAGAQPITIVLVEIRGGRVSLGIEAPALDVILRGELVRQDKEAEGGEQAPAPVGQELKISN